MPQINHIFLVGYWVGQFETLTHLQALLNVARFDNASDQEAQLELDRHQALLDEKFRIVETALFEIPRSN